MRTNAAFREFEAIDPAPVVKAPAQAAPPEPQTDADWRHPSDMPAAVHGAALVCWLAFLGVSGLPSP